MNRTYSNLVSFRTFLERYNYLRLRGMVGESTFGFDRYLNQALYSSSRWRKTRDAVIIRDEGCDLGIRDYQINKGLIVHHLNPITIDDVEDQSDEVFDPEFLICVSPATHNAIHFGDETLLPKLPVERRPGDTCPWRRGGSG